MKDVLEAVLSGILPAIAAALLLFGVGGVRGLGLAFGAALFGAFCLLRNVFPVLPHDLFRGSNDYLQWLCWSVVAAGLLGLAAGPRWFALPAGVAVLGAEVWFVLTNRRPHMTTGETVLHHAAALVLLVGAWLAVRRSAERRDGIGLAFLLLLVLGADSAVLMLGGSVLLSQLAGTIAAVLATSVVTALWHRPLLLGAPAMLALVAAHGGLLLAGVHYSELQPHVAALAAVAPAAALLAGDLSGRARWRLVGAVFVTLLALAGAVLLSPPPPGWTRWF